MYTQCYNIYMKMIRIEDEHHKELQILAKDTGTSITKLLTGLLNEALGENKKSDTPKGIYRDKKAILAEINDLSYALEMADESNQDPSYWKGINKKKKQVEALWKEWHVATE